jgi:hypothetical protein
MASRGGIIVTVLVIWGTLSQIAPGIFGIEAKRESLTGLILHPAVPWIAGAVLVIWLVWTLVGVAKRVSSLETSHEGRTR